MSKEIIIMEETKIVETHDMGDIYQIDVDDGSYLSGKVYILAQLSHLDGVGYTLISLKDGNRFDIPVATPDELIKDIRRDYVLHKLFSCDEYNITIQKV